MANLAKKVTILQKLIANFIFPFYNTAYPYIKETFMKGGALMNSADVIFYLLQLLLEEKDKKESANED